MNILVSNPTPHPAALHIRRLCTADPSLACEMRLEVYHSVPQVCILLFLPLVINTTPQAVAPSSGLATQHARAPILLCKLEKGGRGCSGNRQSSFYRTTPELTEEYMSPVGQ